jgi:hypothetical protein
MSDVPEFISPLARGWRDVGLLALLALGLTPLYLLLNQQWQSVIRLTALYGLLGLFCIRLGTYVRHAMRRLPAEIPPWHGTSTTAPIPPWMQQHFGVAEVIRSVRQDPRYLQQVLKPRLQRLLVYRLTGVVDMPLEALDDLQLSHVDPTLLDFLRRQEPAGLWARYRYRWQRVDDVLDTLRRLEAL